MVDQITAWSFSRYKDYSQCPLKAKYKHVDKIREPGNAAMERGSSIHKMAEDYTRGLLKTLPPELKLFKAQFNTLRKENFEVEGQWAFTAKWDTTDWFAKDAWLRIKMDVSFIEKKEPVLYVIDHKTGRTNPDHKEQLSLYAVAGAVKYADKNLESIATQLWYIDSGEIVEHEFTMVEIPAIKKDWLKRVKAMLTDTTFKPKPGNHCRWCHFSKAKGGGCPY